MFVLIEKQMPLHPNIFEHIISHIEIIWGPLKGTDSWDLAPEC